MSNKQTNESHISIDLDQKASDLLFKLSIKTEQENILKQSKGFDQNINFLARWNLTKSPYIILKDNTKKQSKIAQEESLTDSAKKRNRRFRDNDKIDLALDATACVDLTSCDFCSETGFYMKYKSLVRSLASQKWRAWTAGVTPITRGQLRAKMSNSAKSDSLNENLQRVRNQERASSSDNTLKDSTDEDLIYPSKLHETPPSLSTEASFASQRRLVLDINPPEARERKLALRNQKVFPHGDLRRCVGYKSFRTQGQTIRQMSQFSRNRPSIPAKNAHMPHSFDCCGRSFSTMSSSFPPISGQNIKNKKTLKKH